MMVVVVGIVVVFVFFLFSLVVLLLFDDGVFQEEFGGVEQVQSALVQTHRTNPSLGRWERVCVCVCRQVYFQPLQQRKGGQTPLALSLLPAM